MLKKTVSIALLSSLALMSVQSLQPRPAQAVVGAVSGNMPALLTGGSLLGISGIVAINIDSCTSPNRHCWPKPIIMTIGTGGAALMGLIVLDGDTAEFGALSAKQARTIKVTSSERRAFNEELAEINAIHAQVMKELAAEHQATGEINVELSRTLWNDYGTELSPEAFAAVKKVVARAMQSSVKSRNR